LAACHEQACKDIAAIRSLWQVADEISPAAIRAEMEKFLRALQKVREMASELSPVARKIMFPGTVGYEFFLAALDDVIEDIDLLPYLIQLRKQAPSKPLSKVAAGAFARALMENYSDFPPTLTKGGAFFCVASLLFEGATGKHAASRPDSDPEKQDAVVALIRAFIPGLR
jgi:hypothetical protein